ncbi:MAG: MoaD/ThiS family protein [Proteobacteria bacterium]|nr:MoaD/ThiS family protein [Pseudomonadota bacterium]
MIQIDLKLFVTLSKYSPKNSECLKIPEETTVEKLIADLGIPSDLVKLIFINGKMQDLNYLLKHNDRVGLFPPVGGG